MTDQAGLLVIDKPAGVTSHDVVARVRRLAHTRRVGHAGTLDPMATGVLILGLNRATKLLTFITGTSKEYQATIRLGVSTTTDDAEGEMLSARGCPHVDGDEIERHLVALRGPIMQVPATVSAIKVDGQRAYRRVRQGEEVKLAARPITIHRFETVGSPRPGVDAAGIPVVDIDVIVECSSGTYIRSLARDLGTALGVGGHLTALRRTRVGEWSITQATPLADLEEGALPLEPLGDALVRLYPSLVASAQQAAAFRHGQAPRLELDEAPAEGALFALVDGSSSAAETLGLLQWSDGKLKTALVSNPTQ